MKKYILTAVILSALLTLLFFSSCSDILDVNAYSKITNEGIEDSDKGADMWVMGAYNGLSRMYVYDEFPRSIELDNDYVTGQVGLSVSWEQAISRGATNHRTQYGN